MNDKKLTLALIGKDVSKSISGKIHTFILSKFGVACEYESISLSQNDLDCTVRRLLGDFDGFNVTIPYKRDIFEYLEGIQGDAAACGAVNTVVCATKQGYNTDCEGFLMMLADGGISVEGAKVLLVGGGGAGRSSAVALKRKGAQVFMYRRNRAELEEVCAQLGITPVGDPETGGYDILINCSGVGMHDTVGKSPVTAKAFTGAKAAVDLIYEPSESEFLRLARCEGLKTLNGAAMLFYQGYYADCLFLERQADAEEAKALYKQFLQA